MWRKKLIFLTSGVSQSPLIRMNMKCRCRIIISIGHHGLVTEYESFNLEGGDKFQINKTLWLQASALASVTGCGGPCSSVAATKRSIPFL